MTSTVLGSRPGVSKGAGVAGFRDRREAGRLLATRLEATRLLEPAPDDVVVVGLARGGVEVADEIAAALHVPLDALAVRKVGHPLQPEYGIGAVVPGGVHHVRSSDGLSAAEVERAVDAAASQAAALDGGLHARSARLSVNDRTCVLVDDGLATGGTMTAAVEWARVHRARRVVVAVPVGALQTVRAFERHPNVDAVVCLDARFELGAVGNWYEDFGQLSTFDVAELLDAARDRETATHTVEVPGGPVRLTADLAIPAQPSGWVVFAHGSGSSRRSPRNVSVARALNRAGMATMLLDLLTPDEAADPRTVFDIELLADRLRVATDWLVTSSERRELPIAYLGASTGAAAALIAAADRGDAVTAVVSRGGRPDLAWERLPEVTAPTLLVVGGRDRVVLELNDHAATRLTCPHELAVVADATHLFDEPGALDEVSSLAADWLAARFAEP